MLKVNIELASDMDVQIKAMKACTDFGVWRGGGLQVLLKQKRADPSEPAMYVHLRTRPHTHTHAYTHTDRHRHTHTQTMTQTY